MAGAFGTVADLFVARAGDQHPGLVFEGSTWSWAEVVEQAAIRAAVLADLPGATPTTGDGSPFHVGVLLENVPEFVFLLGGAALAGATVVAANPARRGEELAADIRHTDCRLVITDSTQASQLDGLDLGAQVILADAPDYTRLLAPSPLPSVLPDADALYMLLFTSGSTGAPKAVRLTQGRAASTAAAAAQAFTPDDVLYCAMPLLHGNSLLANLLPGLRAGSTVVLKRRFSATAFLPDVRNHGCTFFNYVGRALSYVLAVPESPIERETKLRWALGSEASPRDRSEFRRRFGCPVIEGYGSSENAVIISPVAGMPRGSLGRPKAGLDVAILDAETGQECPPVLIDPRGRILNAEEAIGEIVGRNSAGLFEGYYNNPEAERERTRGGVYWSGDLGYRDEDGFFYFAGRTADWLRVDGENFSAAPVERILGRFAGFNGVAVYAVPDALTADQVMAAVELDAGVDFDPAAFGRFLDEQDDLGTKWAPRYVRVVDKIPVTGTSKVDKQPLRAARWVTTDPVWWRPVPGESYRLLTDADVAVLHEEFEANGRAALLA